MDSTLSSLDSAKAFYAEKVWPQIEKHTVEYPHNDRIKANNYERKGDKWVPRTFDGVNSGSYVVSYMLPASGHNDNRTKRIPFEPFIDELRLIFPSATASKIEMDWNDSGQPHININVVQDDRSVLTPEQQANFVSVTTLDIKRLRQRFYALAK